MKRDARLRGLSSEHHQALVMARALVDVVEWSVQDGERLAERFVRELEPHFRVEEELLLPALRAVGEGALADRTGDDHVALRALVARAGAGNAEAARDFGRRLQEHVRFEDDRSISKRTITMFVSSLMFKLGARTRGEAVAIATKRGLIMPR